MSRDRTPHPSPTEPALRRLPGEPDHTGALFWPGDEESQRPPGAALAVLIFSFVAGGLYCWQYWPLMAQFDWLAALQLKLPLLAVVGGGVMVLGGVLVIRHGLVWAVRVGALIAAVAMARPLIDAVSGASDANLGRTILGFLLAAGPAFIIFGVSFSPKLQRWRQQQRQRAHVAQRRH